MPRMDRLARTLAFYAALNAVTAAQLAVARDANAIALRRWHPSR